MGVSKEVIKGENGGKVFLEISVPSIDLKYEDARKSFEEFYLALSNSLRTFSRKRADLLSEGEILRVGMLSKLDADGDNVCVEREVCVCQNGRELFKTTYTDKFAVINNKHLKIIKNVTKQRFIPLWKRKNITKKQV